MGGSTNRFNASHAARSGDALEDPPSFGDG
jgi:hypothetical protein